MEVFPPIETAKAQMQMLIRERPGAYVSTVWHGILRIFYFIAGLVALVCSIYMLGVASLQYAIIEETKRSLQEMPPEIEQLGKAVLADPGSLFIMPCVVLLFSIALFILARYCRKIMKRNLYIIETEKVWEELKKYI